MPGVMGQGHWLRDHEHLSFLHWKEWVDAAESLPVAAHVALLRALTIAAKCAGWNRGSPSPVIFVYHSVDRRLPFDESLALATWVRSHVEGHYLPFGGWRLWSAFGDISPSNVRSWNGTVIGLLWFIANGQRQERQVAQASIDAALAEQTAARRAEHARERDRHFARKRTKRFGPRGTPCRGRSVGCSCPPRPRRRPSGFAPAFLPRRMGHCQRKRPWRHR